MTISHLQKGWGPDGVSKQHVVWYEFRDVERLLRSPSVTVMADEGRTMVV